MTPLQADTYLWIESMSGDWNQIFPSPYGPMSPWQDETPFGSNTPPPGGGDTAEFGDVGVGGPMGLTISASGVTVGTLVAGHTTFTGGLTATQEMDFDGYGSGNCMLAGGTYQTNVFNGAVDMAGASVMASGDSAIFLQMTAGSTLNGASSSSLSATVDASTMSFSGTVYIYSVTVQNGGKFTSGDATGGAVFVQAGSSWTVNGAINAILSSPNIIGGGTVTSRSAELEDSGFYGPGQGQGFVVSGAGSKWTNSGAVGIGDDGKDEGALSVMGGGAASISGAVTMEGRRKATARFSSRTPDRPSRPAH